MLSLENISANIAGISVLRSITVQLMRGSIVAVVGRNGAGKTTLLRLIMGFLPGHGGRVLL
ncbi:MAG: ABC superfamily ATP binding cassette transporter, ABC protein, partial [uncultured bacterium]